MGDVRAEFQRESDKLMHGMSVALQSLSYEIQAAAGCTGRRPEIKGNTAPAPERCDEEGQSCLYTRTLTKTLGGDTTHASDPSSTGAHRLEGWIKQIPTKLDPGESPRIPSLSHTPFSLGSFFLLETSTCKKHERFLKSLD